LAKSSKLASEIVTAAGIVCLRVSGLAGHPGYSRLAIGGDCNAAGARLWFRSQREADKVMQAALARCFDSKKTNRGLTVKLPPDHVVDLVYTVTHSLGITAIRDEDVATALDSISRRVETAIARTGRIGTLKNLRTAVALVEPAELLSRLLRAS
jgi:hypothetical protein